MRTTFLQRLGLIVAAILAAGAASAQAPAPKPAEPVRGIEEIEGAWITVKFADVLERPVADAKLVKTLVPGTAVTVTGKVKGTPWYRVVSADGTVTGFVFADAIKDVRATATPVRRDDFMEMMSKATSAMPRKPSSPTPQTATAPAPSVAAAQGPAIRSALQDVVRRTIAPCWQVDPGAMSQVHIRMGMNPDGRVRDVTIVDAARYGQDSNYRVVADAARRAVLDPRCNRLPLPPDDYADWKTLDLTFSPVDVLR